MRKRYLIVILSIFLLAALVLAGCSGSDGAEETVPATDTTAAPATASSDTTAAPAPVSTDTTAGGLTTTTAPATTADGWLTIAKLKSDAAPWQGLEGLLVSESFTVKGDVRVVLDMPGGSELDGVIVAILPEEQATDPMAMLEAIDDAVVTTLIPAAPTKTVSGLDGTYVLVNSVGITTTAWTVEVQVRP